jgi:hypothetical protein
MQKLTATLTGRISGAVGTCLEKSKLSVSISAVPFADHASELLVVVCDPL